jgi:hypothetical protein
MLDDFEEFFEKKTKKPSRVELTQYLFWEKGITLREFEELPIPYILSILRTHIYIKEKEEKELAKLRKKK